MVNVKVSVESRAKIEDIDRMGIDKIMDGLL